MRAALKIGQKVKVTEGFCAGYEGVVQSVPNDFGDLRVAFEGKFSGPFAGITTFQTLNTVALVVIEEPPKFRIGDTVRIVNHTNTYMNNLMGRVVTLDMDTETRETIYSIKIWGTGLFINDFKIVTLKEGMLELAYPN